MVDKKLEYRSEKVGEGQIKVSFTVSTINEHIAIWFKTI